MIVGVSVTYLLRLGWIGFCLKLILLLVVVVIVCFVSGKYVLLLRVKQLVSTCVCTFPFCVYALLSMQLE